MTTFVDVVGFAWDVASLEFLWAWLGAFLGIKEAGGGSGEGAAPPPQCKQSIGSMFHSSSGSRRIKRCSRRARQRERGTEKNKGEKQ